MKPDVAIVTTVEAVHLEHFASVEAIAAAKAEIFEGLQPGMEAQPVSSRQRMFLELARNFALIDNDKHQEALSQMARALAAQSQAHQRDRDD